MNAKDKLRIYLEQRREMGESDMVLDGMSVDEALRALGAAGRGSATGGGAVADSDWRERVARPAGPAGRASPAMPDIIAVPESIVSDNQDSKERTDAMSSLAGIATAVSRCSLCDLFKTATLGVPGTGAERARLVCVGEAPGAKEDESGLPFVGAAGQLLTKILAAVNLSRDEVFITNVVKHRPPGNRNPSPDEIEACSPYLIRQLELIQPKVIVAFGTFAAQTLLHSKLPIGKLRGEVHRYHGIPLVVTYHPAALLRNPSWKRPTWEDVQLARRILDNAVGA
ncbi:MAG: uracil-DNA glycosylase [Gemmatimonadaceae bacterium]